MPDASLIANPQPEVKTRVPDPTKTFGKRPDRLKHEDLEDNYTESIKFLATAVKYMNDNGIALRQESLGEIKVLWQRYSRNLGIRGKQKASMWRMIDAQLGNLRELMRKLPK